MTRTVQKHHVSYDPEETVSVFRGEHQILTLIDRYERKTVSRGFIEALKRWIRQNESRAVDLDERLRPDKR